MAVLNKRVALVTGAAGGIGTAICAALAREGARVVATDRTEELGMAAGAGCTGSLNSANWT